jgi:preprotein translocase subunit SecF
MPFLKIIPYDISLNFVKWRFLAFFISGFVVMLSATLFLTKGLNYGVDFKGGILLEIRTHGPADLSLLRGKLGSLGLGDIKLQELGSPQDVVIRIELQPGGEQEQNNTIKKIREILGTEVDYRRVDTVGPKVSESLIYNGILAVCFSFLSMFFYLWIRFEWQFGLCAIIALIHDCFSVLGFYVITDLEFNQISIIAFLTTAAYSINDTVVMFDRIRENIRKYKTTRILEIVNISINNNLSRTTLTSLTTLLALSTLYYFGDAVLESIALPIIWSVIIGTYSSIFIAAALLIYFIPRPSSLVDSLEDKAK